VLRDAMLQGTCTDDRPPSNQHMGHYLANLNERTGQILDRHADKTPKHETK
jgi:hypothetical protein